MIGLAITSMPAPAGDGGDLEELLAEVARGDKDALADLYRQTHHAVYGVALSICRNIQDAEDVAQEVYLRVYRHAERYTAAGRPIAWLSAIARNLARMRLRERNKVTLMEPEEWSQLWEDRPAVTPEDRMVLAAVMGRLTDEERQIVAAHAVAGLKHREIARLLELPLSTVLSKYARALNKLRQALKEDD